MYKDLRVATGRCLLLAAPEADRAAPYDDCERKDCQQYAVEEEEISVDSVGTCSAQIALVMCIFQW